MLKSDGTHTIYQLCDLGQIVFPLSALISSFLAREIIIFLVIFRNVFWGLLVSKYQCYCVYILALVG